MRRQDIGEDGMKMDVLIPTISSSIAFHSGKDVTQGDKGGGLMCFSKPIN